ncbi:hypothetical protein [uncultured Brevibacillus sp.]|uniref:hypothetical protein n=1 Tax=uncultured Brevibacillus sp. TaxID=169970 RepID=UPI0025919270|nr:hypothetical protein [uncultured Brevibacillus sp.]
MAKKEHQPQAPELVQTKQEWIESAAYFGAERFEVAGALFSETDQQPLAEGQVKSRLNKYKGGV